MKSGSWIKIAESNSHQGRERLNSEKVYGVSERNEICSVFDHTHKLATRLSLNDTFPCYPEERLMSNVAIDTLNKLEDILKRTVSTHPYKGQYFELYKLACILRGYAATLCGVTIGLGGSNIGYLESDWVREKCEDLTQCREEIDCISEVAIPDSIPSDWRKTVADVGDLASRLVPTILNASGNVKTKTWEPDKDSVRCIREAMWKIGEWSVKLSIQAGELCKPPPAMAAEKPTAGRDAPAGKRDKRSTTKGDARTKLISALALHHKYGQTGYLNLEPIGCNAIAELAKVSGSTASKFFERNFGGHSSYMAKCRDAKSLTAKLKLLYDEFADPSYGGEPMQGDE